MAAGIKLGPPETKEQALARRTREIQEANEAQRVREAQGSRDEPETDEEIQARLDMAAAQIEQENGSGAEPPVEAVNNRQVPDSSELEQAPADQDPKVTSGELPPRRPRGRPRKRRPNVHQEGTDTSQVANLPVVVIEGATMTNLNLPMELTWNDWKSYAKYLRVLEKGVHWWIGDLLIYADQRGKHWEENGIQYLAELGFADQTLTQIKSVVSHFGPGGKKRHEALSFEHHRAVAYLPPKLAEELLVRAEIGDGHGNSWTTKELEEEIRAARAKGVMPTASKIGKAGRQARKSKQEVQPIEQTGEASPAVQDVRESPQPPAETAPQAAVEPDNAEGVVDGAYDFAEHTEIRNRARAAVQEWLATGENDLEAGHEAVSAAIEVLVELRDSYERLGVEP